MGGNSGQKSRKTDIDWTTYLGELKISKPGVTVERLQLRAMEGDATFQALLGDCYEWGRGVARDAGEAARWYQKAAEQGNAEAQLTLGDMYSGGRGRCGSGWPRWPDSANPVSEDPGTLHHVEVGRG